MRVVEGSHNDEDVGVGGRVFVKLRDGKDGMICCRSKVLVCGLG